MHGYWQTARHPWPCLLFVLPLLVLYEGAILWQMLDGQAPARAGMDGWMGSILREQGFPIGYAPSLLMGLICVGWAIVKWDRSPPDALGSWLGIILESLVYALALWGLGAVVTAAQNQMSLSPRLTQATALVGAGIYEEIVFRLLGFGILLWVLQMVLGRRIAVMGALILSALAFAGAHYAGPQGESWHVQTFVFRFLAGGCFAALFHFRGLGVAVGTHSAYNLLVGLVAS